MVDRPVINPTSNNGTDHISLIHTKDEHKYSFILYAMTCKIKITNLNDLSPAIDEHPSFFLFNKIVS